MRQSFLLIYLDLFFNPSDCKHTPVVHSLLQVLPPVCTRKEEVKLH